jgi:dipeptidyl aminopeptidase/acylaminoacyl peptidase
MKFIRIALASCGLLIAVAAFSQTGGKPAEKIVFVRPDPVITTTPDGVRRSANTVASDSRGGVTINSVDDPGMDYRSAADAKMNLLAVMNLDGSGITALRINGYDPSVSPDGTKIAFCSLRDDQYSQIYVANSDGTGEKRITKITTGDSCGPVWSHDGKKIAFYSFAQPHPSRNPAVWVMDPDGSNMKRLAEHGMEATWSPDDKQIAFASNRDGKFQIYVMSADGSNPRRLTNNKAEDSSPAWAPDGGAVVFVSDREGEHPALFLMGADGSQQHRLIFSKRQDFCFPAWSLDGSTIAFSALNRVGPQYVAVGVELPHCEEWTGEYQMFTVDGEGKLHQLTNTKYMATKPAFGRLVASH